MTVELRVVGSADWSVWRGVRRAALAESPRAFGSTLDDWSGAGDTEARWRARLDDVPYNVIAFVDGEPVGQVSGTAPASDGSVGVISMWVAPSQRGCGVADALLAAVESWARTREAPALVLSVKRTNPRAGARYRKVGFILSDTPADDPTEQLMVKPLGRRGDRS